MKNFFKQIKRYFKMFLILLLLVSIQVLCDAFIPIYGYKTIYTGIQNDGIYERVPEVIRRSSMKELTNFMTKEDKNKVLNSYSFINNKYELYTKKYPVLKEEAIYLLNGERDKDLDKIIENAILFKISDEEEDIEKSLPEIITLEDEEFRDSFNRLTDDEKNEFIKQFNKNKKEIEDNIISEGINKFIRKEYKDVGVDITSIKTEYLIKSGIVLGILFVFKIIIAIYISKKIISVCLHNTMELSKKILDKTKKLTYQEIKRLNVKELITKNKNDIYNYPFMVIKVVENLIYITAFTLIFIMVILDKIDILLLLKLTGVSLASIILILGVIVLILTKLRYKKYTNKSLIASKILSVVGIALLLILTIVGIVLAILNVDYIGIINLTLGNFILIFGFSIEISVLIIVLLLTSYMVYKTMRISLNIKKVDESENYIKDPEKRKKFKKKGKHYIEFKNVSFKEEENFKLTNINFKIGANSIFGILSTDSKENDLITKLILKLEDLSSGSIVIDGVAISDLEISDLRSKIYCFYPKNVWYYEEDLESTKFLKSPDIYILNDFNSDLNLENDESLNYFLTKKAKNKIVIILSSNPNNLINASKIAVIDKGKLVGLGKHKELEKNCKEYQEVVNSE